MTDSLRRFHLDLTLGCCGTVVFFGIDGSDTGIGSVVGDTGPDGGVLPLELDSTVSTLYSGCLQSVHKLIQNRWKVLMIIKKFVERFEGQLESFRSFGKRKKFQNFQIIIEIKFFAKFCRQLNCLLKPKKLNLIILYSTINV